MAKAALDVGSNSILLTVIDHEGRLLHDEARVVGLGRGLGDRGLFASDRMAYGEQVLNDYVKIANQYGVTAGEINAVATSGARRAMNATTWFQRLSRTTGLKIRIISGDEEARLSWLGARRDLIGIEGSLLVMDVGGGSTELVLGEGEQIFGRASLEIGSVRLTEAFLGFGRVELSGLARLRNHVDTLVATVKFDPAPRTVIGVAGTVTTLCAMTLGLEKYDRERIHGSRLERADLARIIDRLCAASAEERRSIVAISPDRSDVLLAGAMIIDRVLQAARRSSLLVSDRGLRFGLLDDAVDVAPLSKTS